MAEADVKVKVDERRDGRIARDTVTVFLHTGGMPALFAAAYAEWVATGPPVPFTDSWET